MNKRSIAGGVMFSALALVVSMALHAQLPGEPGKAFGLGITGAFEGWFKNPDGTFSLLVGYLNRNQKETLDIAVGPDNKFEPGNIDRGQPTHFIPRRQWGVFRVVVPKDFGDKKLKWTITANGQTNAIPLSLNPLWEISPFKEESMGNTPPVLSFESGAPVQGPLAMGPELTATVGVPLDLPVNVKDDAKILAGAKEPPKTPPVVLSYEKFRGPGDIVFSNPKPPLPKDQKVTPGNYEVKLSSTATFSEPGQYVILVNAYDWSGEGGRGFQCCWTTGHIKVLVKAK
jgi:hypothetical protein